MRELEKVGFTFAAGILSDGIGSIPPDIQARSLVPARDVFLSRDLG